MLETKHAWTFFLLVNTRFLGSQYFGNRNLGVAFQTHPGSQASSPMEAKLRSPTESRRLCLGAPECPEGSQASCGVCGEDSGWLFRPCRRRRPSSLDDGGMSGLFSSGGPRVRFLTR